MKVIITRLRRGALARAAVGSACASGQEFGRSSVSPPRYPARYIGRHRAPHSLPAALAVGSVRRVREALVA
jgi:hypothetical protein